MKVHWLDTFELGVPEIDGDHRTMVALMRAIESAMEAERQASSLGLIDRLFDYCRDHFRREEILLRSWGYAEVDGHRAYHDEMFLTAAQIRATCVQKSEHDGFRACCDEMMRFLIDDVVRGDIKLKSFLQHRGLTLNG